MSTSRGPERIVRDPLEKPHRRAGSEAVDTLVDDLRRTDHGGPAKAGWTLVIVVLPPAGALAYILTRPEMMSLPIRPAF